MTSPTPAVTPATVPATTVEPIPASGLHTVQPKENLYSVARRFQLRPADIVAWNELPANPSLKIGQILRLTAPAEPPAATPPATASPTAPASATPATTVRYTVQAGETMYAISRKYGVTIKQIMEWNSKPDFAVKPGEVLLITPAN